MSARRAPRSSRGHLSRQDMLLISARDFSGSALGFLRRLAAWIKAVCRCLLGSLHRLALKIRGAFHFLRGQLQKLAAKMKGECLKLRGPLNRLATKIRMGCRFLQKHLRRLAVKMLASAFAAFSAGFIAAAAAVSLWQIVLIALGRSHRFDPLQVLVYALLSGAAAAVLFGTLMRKYSKLFPREEEKSAKAGGGGQEGSQESQDGGEGGTAE